MARRKPAAARSGNTALERLNADDLDDKLKLAGVPKERRPACVREIDQLLDFYDDRLARRNAPSEASQAESMRCVAATARELLKVLALLPPALRLAVEPDYQRCVLEGFGRHIAKAFAVADLDREEAARDPKLQWFADQTASLPQSAQEDVRRASPELLARSRTPLPLETILTALIETAEKRRADFEALVSPGRSKQRHTHWRNQLVLNLKAIVMAYSPKLKEDERGAEDWAAEMLDAIGVLCPHRADNPRAFRAMFLR